MELRRSGFSLKKALVEFERERFENLAAHFGKIPHPTELLSQPSVKLKSGSAVSLIDLLLTRIMACVRQLITDGAKQLAVIDRLRNQALTDIVFYLLDMGFNPVLLIRDEGELKVEVSADFMLPFYFSEGRGERKALLVIDLLRPIQATFRAAGMELPIDLKIRPIPQVAVDEGGKKVRYNIEPGKLLGFNLSREKDRKLAKLNNR
jgi:hypothetical protein